MRMRWRALVVLCAAPGLVAGQAPPAGPRAGIETFNRALDDATRRMDNAAIVALWEDDGVSLLPSTEPIVGKRAIADFMAAVTARYPGGRMERFDNRCFDIEVAGPWASEWCREHQIVLLPDGKRFEGWGKMLLVLHRGADGAWRIKREMWNQALAPDSTAARGRDSSGRDSS